MTIRRTARARLAAVGLRSATMPDHHTPGPWTLHKNGLIQSADRHVLIDTRPVLPPSISDSERAANAQLVATAPELLAAARLAYRALGFTSLISPLEAETFQALRIAIHKATGEMP